VKTRRVLKGSKSVTPVTQELGRREANKEDKKARIIDAGWGLFAEQGFAATTTADLAARAGIAKGTLFLYATDKEDLVFLMMHDRLQATVDELLAGVPKRAGLVDQLVFVFSGLYGLYARCGEVGKVFVKALPGSTGANAAQVNGLTFAFLHRVAALVIEAQTRGEVRADVEPMLATQSSFALYFSGILLWVQGLATIDQAREVFLRPSLELLLRGLRR
jgi:TetR/AcrR family transcriptional regulator, cholesterol catabolism regulator